MVGRSVEQRDRVALGDVGQQRKQFVPNSIANESWIVVARIDERFETDLLAQLLGLEAPKAQERMTASGAHRRQPVGPGTTGKIDQHRLGLVIGGVPEQCSRPEGAMTGCPSTRFEIGARGHLDDQRFEGRIEATSSRLDAIGFVGRTRAKTMVDVHGRHLEPGRNGKREQRQRVRASRDTAHHRCLRCRKVTPMEQLAHESDLDDGVRSRSSHRSGRVGAGVRGP